MRSDSEAPRSPFRIEHSSTTGDFGIDEAPASIRTRRSPGVLSSYAMRIPRKKDRSKELKKNKKIDNIFRDAFPSSSKYV